MTLFLIGYLVSGALIFQSLEKEHDMKMLEGKAEKILGLYKRAEEEFQGFCDMDKSEKAPWRKEFYQALSMLSSAHEKRNFQVDPYKDYKENNYRELIKPRWTYIEAVLYSLSILTTTGWSTYIYCKLSCITPSDIAHQIGCKKSYIAPYFLSFKSSL